MLHMIVGYVGLVVFSLAGVGLLLALPRHPRLCLYSMMLGFLYVVESLNQVHFTAMGDDDGVVQNLGQTVLNALVWAVALCEMLWATMSSSDLVLDRIHQVELPNRDHMLRCSERCAITIVVFLFLGNFSAPDSVLAISLLLVAPLCALLLLHIHVGNMWRSSRLMQLWLGMFALAGLVALVMVALGPGYFAVVSDQALWISMLPTHLLLLMAVYGLLREAKTPLVDDNVIIGGRAVGSLDDDSGQDVLRSPSSGGFRH